MKGAPGGLGFLQSGEAVVRDMHGRSIVRWAGGQPIVHADLAELTGTIDDMIVDKIGRTYVGDLGFDLKSGIKSGPYGRIILVEAGRQPRVVADGLHFPHGIPISDHGPRPAVSETNCDCLASVHIPSHRSLQFHPRISPYYPPLC